MSYARAALVVVLFLVCGADTGTTAARPAADVWPMDVAWARPFPFGGEFSAVLGQSRLFIVEPNQISAHAITDGAFLWKSTLTATTRPVADEGRLFVAAAGAIHALSEVSGHVEWRLPVGVVSVSPTARAGWLIVASDDATMRGLSTSNGRVVWQIDLPAPLVAPLALDGDLMVGAFADGQIVGWRVTDGARLWARSTGTRASALLAARGTVFMAGADGRLVSLRQRDGRQNWEYRFGMGVIGRLAADASHIYVTTIDNSVRAHGFNGHQQWRQPLSTRVVDGLVADSGSVFVPQSNGEIRMFVADDGERAGRLAAPVDVIAIGGLAATGFGGDLLMTMTLSGPSGLTVKAYRRTGIAATSAVSAPPGSPLLLSRPGGRP